MRPLRFFAFTFLLWGIAPACWPSGGGRSASGGAGGGSSGIGGASGGFPDVTWKENGVLRAATYASQATRHTTAASDTFNVVATDLPASATLSFAVSSQALRDGTYGCGSDGGDRRGQLQQRRDDGPELHPHGGLHHRRHWQASRDGHVRGCHSDPGGDKDPHRGSLRRRRDAALNSVGRCADH